MIVDSSALLATLRKEPEAARFTRAILRDPVRLISAANFLEAGTVIDNQAGLSAGRRLDAFVERAVIAIEPVTEEQVRIGRQAYVDFGRGNDRAELDSGDCFAYALAKATGEPLLFKGDDFQHTDVRLAWFPSADLLIRPVATALIALSPTSARRPSVSSSWGLWLRSERGNLRCNRKPGSREHRHGLRRLAHQGT
jgi:ribonuclease VapC